MRYITEQTPGVTHQVRRFLLIAGVAVAIVLGGALVLPFLIDVNKYRDVIRAKAEEAIGRRVSLGEMSLTVFPSLGIRVNDPDVEGLLHARSLVVGVKLLPLVFGGAIDVGHVVLDHPEIAVTRAKDGAWNFEKDGAGQQTAGEGNGGSAAPAPARAFSLSKLRILDGAIHLRDDARREGPALTLAFTLDLTASASRSEAGDLRVAFEGKLHGEGFLLNLHGTLAGGAPGAGRASFDITVNQADVEIARARELAASFGLQWPLPEGILKSRSLRMAGRLAGEFAGGAPASLALSDIVVDGADLLLSRDRSGRWNVESLVTRSQAPRQPAAGEGSPALKITNLRLTGSTVTLHDEATGGGGPADIVLNDLRLLIEEFALDRPLVMQIDAKVAPGKGTLSAGGTIPISFDKGRQIAIDAQVDLRDIEARTVAPYLKGLLDMSAESGTISAKAKVSGSYPERIAASGAVKFNDLKVTAAPRPATAEADFDLRATDAAARVEIAKLDITLGRSRLSVAGSIDNRGQANLVDLEVAPSSIDAADLGALLVVAGVAAPAEFSSSRPVRVQAKVRGDLRTRQNLDVSGSIEVADFTLRHPMLEKPLEKVNGRVTLRRDGFDMSDFSGAIGSSDISGRMSVAGLDAPRVTFALASRHADFWELMSFLKEEPAGGAIPAPSGQAAPTEDYPSKISARGTLAIADGSFGTLAFTGLTSTLALDGKVMRLDPISMKLYDGTMTGSATIDLMRDPSVYSVSAATQGLDINALLAANLQMKDTLSGKLSGDLSITTSGTSRDAALGNARGSGQVRIDNGHAGAINVLKIVSRAGDVLGERSLKEVSGKLAKQGTDFSLLSAELRVDGGKISSNSLRMTSPDFELKDDGTLDMMAGTIHVAGQIIFSEALSEAMAQEKSRAVDYFWDDRRGRVNLPLTLSGPVASPTPGIDWGSAGGRLAGRKLREKVSEKLKDSGLGDLLGDRAGKQPPVQAPGGETNGSAPSSLAPSTTPPPGDLSIAIEESGFTGNLLIPDLKVKGTLRGIGITSASVTVTDEKGRVVAEESLAEKINKYYTAHDRAAPASINFRVTVDGGKLAGSRKGVQAQVTVKDAGGRVATKTVQVNR